MALFGSKKKEVKKAAAPEKGKKVASAEARLNVPMRALKQPRITEKATLASEHGAYVFEVDLRATKRDIRAAFKAVYNVTPRKINVVQIPSKKIQSRFRGLYGVTSRGKKAYIYLNEGETIDIV